MILTLTAVFVTKDTTLLEKKLNRFPINNLTQVAPLLVIPIIFIPTKMLSLGHWVDHRLSFWEATTMLRKLTLTVRTTETFIILKSLATIDIERADFDPSLLLFVYNQTYPSYSISIRCTDS